MTSHQEADRLTGRKKVHLRARPNLVVTARTQGGRRSYVVKDPVSLRYFHLEEPQRFLLERMDGRHSLEEIQKEFEAEYRPLRLSLAELEALAGHLVQCGLVQSETGTGRHLFRRAEEKRRKGRWARLLNVFYYKFPLFAADRVLTRLLPVGRVFFQPVGVVAAVAVMLAAAGLLIARWDEFLGRLPAYREFFSWNTLLYVWLALGLVKILHELGHGLCCKAVGGQVHEAGVALLCFFPTLYCDVTDCWALPDKRRRMAVSAAGIYVELFIAAVATFVWWATGPATFLHNLAFGLVLTCGAHTLLFNANPLMRFDGYFVFSDWLEIPNLAQQADQRLRTLWLRWLGADAGPEIRTGAARPGFLALYGLASRAYRWAVLAGLLYVVFLFFKEQRLRWVGAGVVLTCLLGALAAPVYRLRERLLTRGGLPEMKPMRLWLTVSLATAVLFILCFVPLPLHVRGIALVQVEPNARQRLVVPQPGGFLDRVHVRDGQRVRKGDVLAELRNPELEIKLRLNEADRALRTEQQQALAAQLSAGDAVRSASSETYDQIAHELAALDRQFESLRTQRDALVLRAPCDGVILGLRSWENQGKWLADGVELGEVGDDGAVRAVLLVEPSDRPLVASGNPAWFLSHGGATWSGVVAEAARVDAEGIPPQLSSRAGGEVVTHRDPVDAQEKPYRQQFLVAVRLPGAGGQLQPGCLGEARIRVAPQTVLWRLQRFLGSTFDRGL